MTSISAGKLWGLRRLADDAGRFKMTAVDQRPPIENLVADRRATAEAPYADVSAVKALLVEELASESSALLLDPHFAYATAAARVPTRCGLVLTLEDSIFEETDVGRRSREIDHWSVEKIKRAGGDAVKVLAWYRPDAGPAIKAHQQEFVARIGDACVRYDLPFVFELLVYPLPSESGHTVDYIEQPGKRAEHVLESVADFADARYGVDVFKLESPMAAADVPEPDGDDGEVAATEALFVEVGRLAGRPWVMLSAGATKEAFRNVLWFAYRAGASGYLAGRAIWWDAFARFPDLEAMRADLAADGVGYMRELNRLTDDHATPWFDHPSFEGRPALAGGGEGFREQYPDFGGAR